MKHLHNLIKQEDGQDLIEFALVLPLFLLLVCGIIDFGWLFYNYISVENAARNAARIACVEYTECCYDHIQKQPAQKLLTYEKSGSSYAYVDINDRSSELTEQEEDVVSAVQNSMPDSVTNVEINIQYTYDMKTHPQGYEVNDRSNGDVVVVVQGDMKVLTPVLGVMCDNMTKTLTSQSTFKVEKHPVTDA